jgi:hypothetical protein
VQRLIGIAVQEKLVLLRPCDHFSPMIATRSANGSLVMPASGRIILASAVGTGRAKAPSGRSRRTPPTVSHCSASAAWLDAYLAGASPYDVDDIARAIERRSPCLVEFVTNR